MMTKLLYSYIKFENYVEMKLQFNSIFLWLSFMFLLPWTPEQGCKTILTMYLLVIQEEKNCRVVQFNEKKLFLSFEEHNEKQLF